MICCSVSGQVLRTMIILIKIGYQDYIQEIIQMVVFTETTIYFPCLSVYMDKELFVNWFKEVLIPGTSSCFDYGWSWFAYFLWSYWKNSSGKHQFILLPSYTTNVLQPLDVGKFCSMKSHVSKVSVGVKLLYVTGDYANINKTNSTALIYCLLKHFRVQWV